MIICVYMCGILWFTAAFPRSLHCSQSRSPSQIVQVVSSAIFGKRDFAANPRLQNWTHTNPSRKPRTIPGIAAAQGCTGLLKAEIKNAKRCGPKICPNNLNSHVLGFNGKKCSTGSASYFPKPNVTQTLNGIPETGSASFGLALLIALHQTHPWPVLAWTKKPVGQMWTNDWK